jgi:hypothetical protein
VSEKPRTPEESELLRRIQASPSLALDTLKAFSKDRPEVMYALDTLRRVVDRDEQTRTAERLF